MNYAYLNASGDVLAIGQADTALEVIQEKVPTAATRIADAPDGLLSRLDTDNARATYHKLIPQAAGTSIEDYTVEEDLTTAKAQRVAEVNARTHTLCLPYFYQAADCADIIQDGADLILALGAAETKAALDAIIDTR